MAQGVADRLGETGLARDPPQLGGEPAVQGFDDRPAALLPGRPPLLGRAAADLRLDRVELADPAQRLPRQGRAGRPVELVKAPPAMHHPNTIDGLHFKTALPFTGAVPAAPRQRRTLASR